MPQKMQGMISIAAMTVFALTVFAQPDQTQPQTRPGRDMEKERAIWQQLEKIVPKSVETFKSATEALDKNDFTQAAKLFEQVVKTACELNAKHPQLMQTHSANALIATEDGDWQKAEEEIKKAQNPGLPAEAAEAFPDSGIRTRAQVWRYLYYSLYLVAAWALGLTLLFILGKLFSNFTLRSIEEADPSMRRGVFATSCRTARSAT